MSASTQTVSATAENQSRVSSWRNLVGLMPYLGRYRGRIALGLATLVLMGGVGNLIPLMIGAAIDTVKAAQRPLAQESQAFGWLMQLLIPFYEGGSRRALLWICVILVGIVVVKGSLSFWTRTTLIGVSRDIEYDLRDDLLVALERMELEFYVRNRTGELMSRCTNDLNAVRMVLGPGIMYSATTIVTMVLAVVLMLRLSPTLTLWVLLPVPIVAFAVRHFGKVIHDLYERIQAALAALSSRAQENLAGVRVIRAYNQEKHEAREFQKLNREYVTRNVLLIRNWSLFMPTLTALIGTTFLLILWKGGTQVIHGELSLGALTAFNAYLALLVWPMIALGWVTNIFQRGAASMGRLNYVLHAKPAIDDRAARAVDGTGIQGEIEFRNLTFLYPTNRSQVNGSGEEANAPVLKDIRLHVPAGSTLAIVGPTGSGKTTLAALVARLWEAPDGTLYIDGRPIREWPLKVLRRAIGCVPQDTFLFSDKVRENIAFGVEDPAPGAVEQAAEIAGIAREIESFPKQYETLVGERGITLSGGQKQRMALARAIIREPRILILDDSLSSVDTDTEERILRRLKEVMQVRTTILISHRCSTVQHADQIVVLRDGRIVERGTHEELLELSGYYADLYQKQLLEEELERA